MTKQERHEKAEKFRRTIVTPVNRSLAINELLKKDLNSFTETDCIHLTVLFQKKEYIEGCQMPYKQLMNKLQKFEHEGVSKKAQVFAKYLSEF